MTWSPEGRRRGRPEMKWRMEVKRVMKQKNVTSEDAVNRQLWRKAIENQQPV
jgi:ribosomal protein L31E